MKVANSLELRIAEVNFFQCFRISIRVNNRTTMQTFTQNVQNISVQSDEHVIDGAIMIVGGSWHDDRRNWWQKNKVHRQVVFGCRSSRMVFGYVVVVVVVG